MKLRVFARPGHVLPWPGQMTSGQIRRYIGRESKLRDGVISHRALEEATELDTDSVAWKRIVTDREISALVPADEASAKAMGVQFVPGKVVDGEWAPDASVDEQAEFRKAREARREKHKASKRPQAKAAKASDK